MSEFNHWTAPRVDLAVTVRNTSEQICTDEEIEACFRTPYKQLKARADAFRCLSFEDLDRAALNDALKRIGSM